MLGSAGKVCPRPRRNHRGGRRCSLTSARCRPQKPSSHQDPRARDGTPRSSFEDLCVRPGTHKSLTTPRPDAHRTRVSLISRSRRTFHYCSLLFTTFTSCSLFVFTTVHYFSLLFHYFSLLFVFTKFHQKSSRGTVSYGFPEFLGPPGYVPGSLQGQFSEGSESHSEYSVCSSV